MKAGEASTIAPARLVVKPVSGWTAYEGVEPPTQAGLCPRCGETGHPPSPLPKCLNLNRRKVEAVQATLPPRPPKPS